MHFHIIPKLSREGLGIGWYPANLDAETGQSLSKEIAGALSAEP